MIVADQYRREMDARAVNCYEQQQRFADYLFEISGEERDLLLLWAKKNCLHKQKKSEGNFSRATLKKVKPTPSRKRKKPKPKLAQSRKKSKFKPTQRRNVERFWNPQNDWWISYMYPLSFWPKELISDFYFTPFGEITKSPTIVSKLDQPILTT
jgi:hypothetical protein